MTPRLTRTFVLPALTCAIGAAVWARSERLTAVLVQVQGNVTIAEASQPRHSRQALPAVRRAQYLQIVGEGDEVHLPAGAGLGLVCSTDRWIELAGGRDQRLTEQLCRAGRPLPPGTYGRLAPAAGRMRSLRGVLVLEGETRGPEDEDFGVPLLLSPRNTAVLDGRPPILWAPIPEATEYEVELTGPHRFRVRLDAAQVSCSERWGEAAVCSLPYPAQERDLPPGTVSFLSIGARRGLAAPLRKEAEPSRVRRLPADRGEGVRAQLERLRDLPLDCATRRLLAADLYAREGLLAEAIPAYRQALALRDAPEVRVTLGDAYLASGLFRLAARSYQELLDGSLDPAVQAAAEFGLGRIEYARRNFEAALGHFRKARDLYATLGLKGEGVAAERAMREAERKRPG